MDLWSSSQWRWLLTLIGCMSLRCSNTSSMRVVACSSSGTQWMHGGNNTCLAYIHCLIYPSILWIPCHEYILVWTRGWEAKRNPKQEKKIKGTLFYILTVKSFAFGSWCSWQTKEDKRAIAWDYCIFTLIYYQVKFYWCNSTWILTVAFSTFMHGRGGKKHAFSIYLQRILLHIVIQ